MIKEAIQYIVALSAPTISDLPTGMYSDKPLHRLTAPLAEPCTVTTLSSLVGYLTANRDRLDMDRLIVHVESPREVRLMSSLNPNEKRATYINAIKPALDFKFGTYFDSENFNIALQAMFADLGDRAEIIKMAGNLIDEAVKTSIDDGRTQTVVTKVGVKIKDYSQVPNPVTLAPYRTFIEVEQPASKFVFRIREGGQMALFEADGGAWRNEAMNNVANYLKAEFEKIGLDVTVLA